MMLIAGEVEVVFDDFSTELVAGLAFSAATPASASPSALTPSRAWSRGGVGLGEDVESLRLVGSGLFSASAITVIGIALVSRPCAPDHVDDLVALGDLVARAVVTFPRRDRQRARRFRNGLRFGLFLVLGGDDDRGFLRQIWRSRSISVVRRLTARSASSFLVSRP